jgi:hypothetical protein
VGDDARDLGSVASKWGLCGSTKLSQDAPPLKIPRSSSLQDGQLTPRLASACVLQDAPVQHLSWWLIGPVLVLGCLSSRGPLGLALGFYRARVRRLDVAHFNCKDELRATKHGGSALRPYSPCFARVLSNVVGRLQACGTLCDIVSLRLHSFAGLKSRSRMSGRGSTRGKEENEKIFGATACSLSALGKIIFCSPSSRADASK